MRVVGGSAKGRRLRSTRAAEMRPTTDMARRTIFDILGADVHDARVLDLFAGAGTLGIEALSRGARDATFVESAREACAVIRDNIRTTGFDDGARVVCADVLRYLSKRANMPFDLVFLDPPYERGLGFVARCLGKVVGGAWVRVGGTVVVEAADGAIEWPSGFRETRARRFGRTKVSMAVWDEERAGGDISGDV